MNRAERGKRASRAAARRADAVAPRDTGAPDPEPFRVLLCLHRPGLRARAERAAGQARWEVRSLLNREDPIGLMNRQAPDVFVVSVDFARKANVGYLRAAQRYRASGMHVVVACESEDDAAEAAGSADVVLAAGWTWTALRDLLAGYAARKPGRPDATP